MRTSQGRASCLFSFSGKKPLRPPKGKASFTPFPAYHKRKGINPMRNQSPTPRLSFLNIMHSMTPKALAWVQGGALAPQLSGLVKFYDTPYGGVLVEAEVFGLPNVNLPYSSNFYAMHIHAGDTCGDNFAHVGPHFDSAGRPHPAHQGDLVPLMGNQGYAWGAFYDKRFAVAEILGKTVVIHSSADDFTSQPAGNPGEVLGCGVIRAE